MCFPSHSSGSRLVSVYIVVKVVLGSHASHHSACVLCYQPAPLTDIIVVEAPNIHGWGIVTPLGPSPEHGSAKYHYIHRMSFVLEPLDPCQPGVTPGQLPLDVFLQLRHISLLAVL
ncbi:hypothetical protein F4778DRAFT_229477 [Xylariomycetidae sp. FL2044]|nr:hypothetical protein F4778DRAFT_229477 [Xylariomycetidae sp. FL2044]